MQGCPKGRGLAAVGSSLRVLVVLYVHQHARCWTFAVEQRETSSQVGGAISPASTLSDTRTTHNVKERREYSDPPNQKFPSRNFEKQAHFSI